VVEIVCDSSFLMILASKRIKNISSIETEIGTIEYVVPDLVVQELKKISTVNSKKKVMPILL
jgi:uncharacterized protein